MQKPRDAPHRLLLAASVVKTPDRNREFELLLRSHGIGGWRAEYRFATALKTDKGKPVQSRFDFAWIEQKFAVEIEGVTFNRAGRHQTGRGFMDDCLKYHRALSLGWTVYRVPAPWITRSNRRKNDYRGDAVIELIRRFVGENGGPMPAENPKQLQIAE